MPTSPFGDYRQYQWEEVLTSLSSRPFVNSLLKLKRRNGGAEYHTSNGRKCTQLYGLSEKRTTKHVTIFLLSGAMYTSAFCHCQACRVHLFHLAVVKIQTAESCCEDEMCFSILFTYSINCMYLDRESEMLNLSKICHTWNIINYMYIQ